MNAIICYGTPNCIESIRYLYGALRGKGQWTEDIVVILLNSHGGCDFEWELDKKGAKIVFRKTNNHHFYGKYFIYGEEFRKYDQILYIDLDFLIFKPVQELFNIYNKESMYWDKTPFGMSVGIKKNYLKKQGIDPGKKMFQAAGILFKPKEIVQSWTTRDMEDLARKLTDVNIHLDCKGNSDEPIQNLYWKRFTNPENEFKEGHLCFVGCRNENTILAHTTNFHKPWQSPDYKRFYQEAMDCYNKL